MLHAKKVIVWGDSVARGVIYDEKRNRYTLARESAARIVAEKLNIEIVNRARMGFTIRDGAQTIENDLFRGMTADAALIEFGGNDCNFDWKAISEAPEDKHIPNTPADIYEEKLTDIIETVRDAGMRPILVTLPPILSDRYFDFISRGGLSRENILQWLGDKNHIYRYHERYSGIISRIATKYRCALLDIRSAFLEKWNTDSLFCIDGIHPSEEGQRFISEAILQGL